MQRRAVLGTSAAVLAALAGCSETSEESENGADDGDGADEGAHNGDEEELTLETFDYPEGVSEDGFDSDLASVQEAYLSEAGSVTVTREQTFEMGGHGADPSVETAEIEGDQALLSTEQGGTALEIWVDSMSEEDPVLLRSDDGSNVRYLASEHLHEIVDDADGIAALDAMVNAASFDAAELDDDDDTPVVVFESAELTDEESLRDLEHFDEYDAFDARATVSTDALVEYEYELEGAAGDQMAESTETITVEDVGETDLGEPEWLDEGLDDAVEMTIELTDDESAIALTMEGGETIPEGSFVHLHADRSLDGILDQDVSEGETLYLYGDGEELRTAVDEEPETDSTFDDQHFFVSVHLETGALAYEGEHMTFGAP
ncbi:hypothetical protein [Natronolimnohabitans innermongolicus]|uniref:Uncharacterized protein n=1 Tax=Natronolimnohabitans innermongolicus JCM 12255 TaxID=1227499 RepID=L9XBS0_9EURY|nr:hypothetical protein [Natronolimnohabitans innermongolicus]ELY59067.1 hypothetical protein C493_05435 [Natronolimnohabitans innermongolicus JCM 12255]